MQGGVDSRIVELETKASFQEAALLDMSKMIVEQGSRIDKLEVTVRDLREKVKGLPDWQILQKSFEKMK